MVVSCEQVWREISNYLEGGIEPDLRRAMESRSAVAGAALLCLTARVTSFSYTAMNGCLKCRWASASACSTGWRRRVCLVAGEMFSGGWLRPRRQCWLLAASRRPDLRSSAILSSVRSTPNPGPVFLWICWSWLQPMGRRFTQQGVRSSTTSSIGQLRPGKRNARGMRRASGV